MATYLDERGQAPWQHRKKSLGYISGSLRYDIIQRASGCCEACGIGVKDRAVEIDHIVPRNKGGTDDRSNLQAFCYLFNAQKRDRDDTDYAAVKASYDADMRGWLSGALNERAKHFRYRGDSVAKLFDLRGQVVRAGCVRR